MLIIICLINIKSYKKNILIYVDLLFAVIFVIMFIITIKLFCGKLSWILNIFLISYDSKLTSNEIICFWI